MKDYLKILDADSVKRNEMKKNVSKKKNFKSTRKYCRQDLTIET